MKTVDPHDAIEFIFRHGRKYAQAKADRTYLEEFRKSQKAMLMKDAEVEGHKTSAAQEREAYAHPGQVVRLQQGFVTPPRELVIESNTRTGAVFVDGAHLRYPVGMGDVVTVAAHPSYLHLLLPAGA